MNWMSVLATLTCGRAGVKSLALLEVTTGVRKFWMGAGMDSYFEKETIQEMRDLPLSNLARKIGLNFEEWFSHAAKPLPETFRVNPHHPDKEWAQKIIDKLGGKPVQWLSEIDAWQMPWPRGKAPDEYSKAMIQELHDIGCITRQELVSMMPPLVLKPQPHELVLDSCASPGSKTTQLALMQPLAGIVANEPNASRLNMLVTNCGRLGIDNVAIIQHDGRFISKIPPPGFDAVLCDVPCTGSATMRKNRGVWWNWSPKDGRDLFSLQVEIVERACLLTRPGGRVVYSTCSMDPIENEAVVLEILHRCPWMKLDVIPVEDLYAGAILHPGFNHWPILDESGEEVTDDFESLANFSPSHLPPRLRKKGEKTDLEIDLSPCVRIYPHDNNTGGFFVAHLYHDAKSDASDRAVTLRQQPPKPGFDPIYPTPKSSPHALSLVTDDAKKEIETQWGFPFEKWAWWQRGKRVSLSLPLLFDRLYAPSVPRNKWQSWDGMSWHPLKVIHAGMPVFAENKGRWRIRQEGLQVVRNDLQNRVIRLQRSQLIRLIEDESLPIDEIDTEGLRGPVILSSDFVMIPGWIGAHVTPMANKNLKSLTLQRLKEEEA